MTKKLVITSIGLVMRMRENIHVLKLIAGFIVLCLYMSKKA